MELVKSREQLIQNIKTLDNYLSKGTDMEKAWSKKRVKLGICFVVYQVANELRFAPSRFIGYIENTLEKHGENKTKDGKVTNPIINDILKTEPLPNDKMLSEYLLYCKRIGIEPRKTGSRGYTRKFWGEILKIEL
jgi:hypothetical protein